jgi:hypothetical protein
LDLAYLLADRWCDRGDDQRQNSDGAEDDEQRAEAAGNVEAGEPIDTR